MCFSRATQEDDMGQLYLSNIDFLKNGVPASIIAMLVGLTHSAMSLFAHISLAFQVVSTVGYLLMRVM